MLSDTPWSITSIVIYILSPLWDLKKFTLSLNFLYNINTWWWLAWSKLVTFEIIINRGCVRQNTWCYLCKYKVGHEPMNEAILCVCMYTGLGCGQTKNAVPTGVQPAFFKGWFCVFWLFMPEQNGSSYFLCTILALTCSTTARRTYLLYPSCDFLVATCYLYR